MSSTSPDDLGRLDEQRGDFFPRCVEREDGTYQAWYPEQEGSVVGDSRGRAMRKLPVRRVVPRKVVEQLGSERWRVSIPELGCAGEGRSSAEAEENLRETIRARTTSEPDFVALRERLFREPPDGWKVVFISREQLMSELLAKMYDGRMPHVEGSGVESESDSTDDALSMLLRQAAARFREV